VGDAEVKLDVGLGGVEPRSEPTLRSASKTPCAYTGQIKPHLNPATTNYFDLKKSEG